MPVLRNARHELFCQEIAKGKTQDEAYELAGYKADRGNASHLRDRPDITERIQQLTTQLSKKTVRTADSIMNKLEMIADKAIETGQLGAAVSAQTTIAKIGGHLIERRDITGKTEVQYTPDQARQALEEYMKAQPSVQSSGPIVAQDEDGDTRH